MLGFNKDHWIGIVIIIGIIAIGLSGGLDVAHQVGLNVTPQSILSTQTSSQNNGSDTALPNTSTGTSSYRGNISLSVSRSTDPSREYITLRANGNKPVTITGWRLTSLSSGATVTIPNGVYLLFSNSQNSRQDIVLAPGEVAYISTGTSPNNESFKLNKCSGYLTQFQNYTPGISTSCPLARNEDLSRIPKYVSNDACFDYIDSYPACKTQSAPLPPSWSPECRNFIENLNYTSCVNTHKNDKDFYRPEWHVFLGRSQSLWKSNRENIVLYDTSGMTVTSVTY